LRALAEAGFQGSALIPIVDPDAVQAAFAAGIGNAVRITVGGALDRRRFAPLPIEGCVRLLSDGWFHSETTRELWQAGKTAVVQAGNFTLVITSRPVSLYDRHCSSRPAKTRKTLAWWLVKSPQCEPHMFRAWAARYVDWTRPAPPALISIASEILTRRREF
jgi:microcystin degradation protein MlrC